MLEGRSPPFSGIRGTLLRDNGSVDDDSHRRRRVSAASVSRAVLVASFAAFAASVFLRKHAGTAYLYDAGLYNVPFVLAAMTCLLRRDHERRYLRADQGP